MRDLPKHPYTAHTTLANALATDPAYIVFTPDGWFYAFNVADLTFAFQLMIDREGFFVDCKGRVYQQPVNLGGTHKPNPHPQEQTA